MSAKRYCTEYSAQAVDFSLKQAGGGLFQWDPVLEHSFTDACAALILARGDLPGVQRRSARALVKGSTECIFQPNLGSLVFDPEFLPS